LQILLNEVIATKSYIAQGALTSRPHFCHPLSDATVPASTVVVLTLMTELRKSNRIGNRRAIFVGRRPRHLGVDPQFLASAAPQQQVRRDGQSTLDHNRFDRLNPNNASVSRARDLDAGACRATHDASTASAASSV
jgi:hypothetical protein